MTENKDMRLSYSSASLLQNCEQRYVHHKVYKTEIDSDSEDSTEAFDLGKAFHAVLENCMHRADKYKHSDVIKYCNKYNVEDVLMIEAMVNKYLWLHQKSGWEVVDCELAISSNTTVGFIDFIAKKPNGNWAIGDLKTSARWNEGVLSRLSEDYQLNLYSSFADLIAPHLKLDPSKFIGCLYRVTTKTKLKQRKTESKEDYYNRVSGNIESYDVFIPKTSMRIEEVSGIHEENYKRCVELFNGEAPKRNYSYCESYFRPCPFWSNCHGDIFSNCGSKVSCNTAKSYEVKEETIRSLL